MKHNIQGSKKHIIDLLAKLKIKHEYHDFASGCCMIDIWKADKFYVVQVEHDSIGISSETEPSLCTVPDERYYDFDEFSKKLNKILEG
jgi:hypothetical protein